MMKKIMSAICVFAVLISLSACEGNTLTEVTKKYLDDFKAQDTIVELIYYVSDESMPETSEYLKESVIPKMLDFDYELSHTKKRGRDASVDMTVTAYAFGDAYKQANKEFEEVLKEHGDDMSDSEIDAAKKDVYMKYFERAEKTYVEKVSICLTKIDDWEVVEMEKQSDVLNAISGGFLNEVY